jgi:hypothetical protein
MGSKRENCDNLWSKIVRRKGYCEMCGLNKLNLHAHHIFGRKCSWNVKYDVEFGASLCMEDHDAMHGIYSQAIIDKGWDLSPEALLEKLITSINFVDPFRGDRIKDQWHSAGSDTSTPDYPAIWQMLKLQHKHDADDWEDANLDLPPSFRYNDRRRVS